MLILSLDTSSPSGSLAVLRDENVIGSISTWTDEAYSSRMFRHLDFLLRELSLGFDAFDLYAAVVGPGSFTGLRVGLAAVKGLAEISGKPIAAVSALEAVAAQTHSATSAVVPVLDARRGQLYFGLYRRVGASAEDRLLLEGDERVATPSEFLEILRGWDLGSSFAIATPTPEIVPKEVAGTAASKPSECIRVDRVSPILAPHVGRLGYYRAKRGDTANSLTLDANYIRKSDAELHWKGPRES